MILVDTSAWVEYMRETGNAVDKKLTHLLFEGADIVTTEPVVMELLAGTRSGSEYRRVRSHIVAFPLLPLRGLADYEDAAAIFRACRQAGETIRSVVDCLVAVPAIRAGARLLHNDTDFEVIARHSPLETEPLRTK